MFRFIVFTNHINHFNFVFCHLNTPFVSNDNANKCSNNSLLFFKKVVNIFRHIYTLSPSVFCWRNCKLFELKKQCPNLIFRHPNFILVQSSLVSKLSNFIKGD